MIPAPRPLFVYGAFAYFPAGLACELKSLSVLAGYLELLGLSAFTLV